MKITNKMPISTLLLCGLAACGGNGDDPMQDPPECTVDCDPSDEITLSPNAISLSISEGNIVSRLNIFDEVENERTTGILPNIGSADYKGYIFTELEGETPLANELHCTIYLNINFLGDEISGDIRNLHTAMNGEPVERLTGSVENNGWGVVVVPHFSCLTCWSGLEAERSTRSKRTESRKTPMRTFAAAAKSTGRPMAAVRTFKPSI